MKLFLGFFVCAAVVASCCAAHGDHHHDHHDHDHHLPQHDGACPHYKIPLPLEVKTAASTLGDPALSAHQCECDAPVKCSADGESGSSRSPLEAVGGSFVTAIVPACALFFFPQSVTRSVLNVMLAFAAGALVSDVLVHSIPALSGGHDHHHNGAEHAHDHSISRSSLLILVGIVLFYILEGVVERLSPHSHSHSNHHDDHHSSKASPTSTTSAARPSKKKVAVDASVESTSLTPRGALDESHLRNSGGLADENAAGSEHTAFLSLLADFSHNVMDGLAIGTAFATSSTSGQRVVAVILSHEIPHELADFALLKSCGWQRRSIVASQLITALGNLIGCLISFYLSRWSNTVESVLVPIVAGSFLYLALCVILPQLGRAATSPAARVAHGIAFIFGALALDWLS